MRGRGPTTYLLGSPISNPHLSELGMEGQRGLAAYRISSKTLVIILCSACRTAISRPLASHSHCAMAGAEQMAQSGSIFLVGGAGGQDRDRRRLRCFFINMIVGRK